MTTLSLSSQKLIPQAVSSNEITTFIQNTNPEEIESALEELMVVLSDKEKFVISSRYALAGHKKLTLAEIGNHFSVTRERIRQVENYSLQKLQRAASANNNLLKIAGFVKELLIMHGGVMSQDKIIEELIRFMPHVSRVLIPELKLVICLDSQIVMTGNTVSYQPHFRLHDMTMENILLVSKVAIDHLDSRNTITSINDLISAVQDEIGFDHPIFKTAFIKACVQIDKRIKIKEGQVSLHNWRHINPRTLREKITFVLRYANRPLHFIEIADEIKKKQFNNRMVNTQAVHNELINCEDFVLIGRGIYALREWGYSSGTVSEVISRLLQDKGPLFLDQITKNVLDRRQVKRITISVNLKNRDLFKRLPDGRYGLR